MARYPSTKGMTIGDDPNDAKKPAIAHSLYGWQYTSAFTCSGLNNSTDASLLYVEAWRKRYNSNKPACTRTGQAE